MKQAEYETPRGAALPCAVIDKTSVFSKMLQEPQSNALFPQ